MHQPLYKDRLTGRYLMPWVRMHAIKDYLDMVLILEKFPRIRQTVNMVPSLMEQLEDYALREATDEQLELTIKPIDKYTDADKVSILSESFHANYERMIKLHPPYVVLSDKRAKLQKEGRTFAQMIDHFTPQEYADMATWFNLVWFDPIWPGRLAPLKEIVGQGANFTLAQRQAVIEMEREIIRQTLPTYRRMQDEGQIEVTTTPYYHPILPLLIDTNAARLANPHSTMPQKVFFHQEDAQHQIEEGLAAYEKEFGRKARGMWPSEMSGSPAAIELIAKSGIKWIVLDEGILSRTTESYLDRDIHGNLNSAQELCQPYRIRVGDEELTIVFREVVLSNELSFSYGARPIEEASSALYMRLKHIQQRLFNWEREGVVVIALDGENCWETYELDGNPFLNELYKRLSQDPTLNICTVSDYLKRHPPTARIHNLQAGSWIGSDFHIWIGDPLKNVAWDLLGDTRNFLVDYLKTHRIEAEVQKRAWEEIYAAEGSDWFWWFGEPNNSVHDPVFDQQFRLRLQNVYKVLGEPHPVQLDVPVHVLVAPKIDDEAIASSQFC
jgi:alpha-amylase/alpha-mannosidase (GH57 family)